MHGVEALAPISDVIIIVDVLSYTTTVEVAAARGAMVAPYRFNDDESAGAFARENSAELAGPRGKARYSLSPTSVREIARGVRLVLPSPNGSTLSLSTGSTPTIAGCLRNASAVARYAESIGETIAVIPAGERWIDGSLRPAVEDLIGAGAILSRLAGGGSPEARIAIAAFEAACGARIHDLLLHCASGRELAERGYADDIAIAAEHDVSQCVPILRDGAYIAAR